VGRSGGSPAQAANTAELTQFGLGYATALRSFFSRRAPADDAEDLVQEVLLRIQKRRPDVQVQNVEGYLFEVAANVLVDRARRNRTRRRSAHCELTESHHPVDDISPERVLQGREEMAVAIAALNELPERTRQVFTLVRFESMSYKLVASRFGISVSAVEKHVMKAMRHMSERLRDADDVEQADERQQRGPR
jgi:RNA polymerase sigma factor (sigma-70 family)